MKYCLSIVVLLLLFIAGCKNDDNANSSDEKRLRENNILLHQLEKQIAANRDSIGLRLKLVDALDSLNNYKEAAAQLDSLIGKDSLNYGLWFRKGRLLETAKDTFNAILSYNKALKIYPSPDGQLQLANLLAESKNENALVICQRVQELRLGREYSAHCNFIAGVYFARIGNKQKALQLFDACINDNFAYMEAYQEKGFIFYDDKKFAEALKIFQMAANVNNTYADAYYWQAKCFEAMNKKEEAIKNYQTSLVLDKNLKEAKDALKRLQ
ncbi:tetratricopeptide repeat protein [mine drainage metagenome]|uniref:Tetratricopeptide repeat protein n=1 Tax=mine drainage metagenome TaxID=410659 RepID=A0A1J5S001_9ZZZZ